MMYVIQSKKHSHRWIFQNISYHFSDLIINLKSSLLHLSHVICNYRHIFTVLANFRVCKSETFIAFVALGPPALWSHPYNKDENPPLTIFSSDCWNSVKCYAMGSFQFNMTKTMQHGQNLTLSKS